MKRTSEDDEFVLEFSRQLNASYAYERQKKLSDEEFARSIGVSRTALQKYLDGKSMPSLRTVVLCYTRHKIAVPYSGTRMFTGSPRRKQKTTPEQLILPLAITALHSKPVGMKLDPKGLNAFELKITVQRTG